MMRGLQATLLGAAMLLPQTAAACQQLSAHVWMCARGTPWETAEWDPYGDGATLLMGDYILNFTEDFPGADIRDDLTTLPEQFVTYAELVAADGNAPLEVRQQETFDIPGGRTFRSLQRDNFNDIPSVSAVMLAEIDVARIMLWLDAPASTSWAEIDTASLEVLDTLRNSCGEPDSCAGPDQERVDTE